MYLWLEIWISGTLTQIRWCAVVSLSLSLSLSLTHSLCRASCSVWLTAVDLTAGLSRRRAHYTVFRRNMQNTKHFFFKLRNISWRKNDLSDAVYAPSLVKAAWGGCWTPAPCVIRGAGGWRGWWDATWQVSTGSEWMDPVTDSSLLKRTMTLCTSSFHQVSDPPTPTPKFVMYWHFCAYNTPVPLWSVFVC